MAVTGEAKANGTGLMSRTEDAILQELRRPFTPAAVKFKVQTNPKAKNGDGFTQAMLVTFIDARLVSERLNHVVGADWSDSYEAVSGGMLCKITVGTSTRCDVGWSKGTGTDMDLKALYSDAFKRAGVKWGVGVSLYALPRIYLPPEKLVQRGTGKDSKWFLPDRVLPELQARYQAWLEGEGHKVFGEPLDHGDHQEAQGDVEVGDPTPEKDADPLELPRQKVRWMLAAACSKDESVDRDSFREGIDSAESTDDLAVIYGIVSGALKDAGGDVALVEQRWAERQAA